MDRLTEKFTDYVRDAVIAYRDHNPRSVPLALARTELARLLPTDLWDNDPARRGQRVRSLIDEAAYKALPRSAPIPNPNNVDAFEQPTSIQAWHNLAHLQWKLTLGTPISG